MFYFKCKNEWSCEYVFTGDKFMAEIHLKQSGLVHSQKTRKELKNLFLKPFFIFIVQTLFIKMNLIKFVFTMIWLMANQKI